MVEANWWVRRQEVGKLIRLVWSYTVFGSQAWSNERIPEEFGVEGGGTK